MALQDVDSGFQFGEDPPWDEDHLKDIKDIFREAQETPTGKGCGRCAACGGVFQQGECIECGHKI